MKTYIFELLWNLLKLAKVMRPPQQGDREKKICTAASPQTYNTGITLQSHMIKFVRKKVFILQVKYKYIILNYHTHVFPKTFNLYIFSV